MQSGITADVIKEIYKKCKKDPKNFDELNLPYFTELLSEHHQISRDEDEIVIDSFDPYNPFRRFLLRSVKAILEFDHEVAIVCRTHIIFLNKFDSEASVHMKPEEKRGFFDRLFGGDDEEDMDFEDLEGLEDMDLDEMMLK